MRAELHRKDEELSQVKANAQEDALRIKKLWDQVSDAEAQHEEDSRRIEALQGQLETALAELQRKDEALRRAEAKSQEALRRVEALQQEREREKPKKRLPPMSGAEFFRAMQLR